MQDANNREGGGGRIYGNSLYFLLFFCKPKLLKKKSLLIVITINFGLLWILCGKQSRELTVDSQRTFSKTTETVMVKNCRALK